MFQVPIVIPILILLVSLYLVITPIILEPTPKYLIAIGFMMIGILVYYWFIYKNNRPRSLMSKYEKYKQESMQSKFEVTQLSLPFCTN